MNTPLERVQAKAAEWNARIDELRETPSSLLGFGVREGTRVVLKITKQTCDESHSGEVLKAYAGVGAARVYESTVGAVLLERLEPGEQLVDVVKRGEDEEATRIMAEVIGKLAGHHAPSVCPAVADWGGSFERYLRSDDEQIDRELVRKAGDMYQDLASSQRTQMLLHGDLQHYNVLLDHQRGWVAIDPKGVVGEFEYEVGALLRNPMELPEIFAREETIKRRLEILTNSLQLDYTRALRWSYAQAVLSAIWGVEDGYRIESNNPGLLLARAIDKIYKIV